MNRRVLIGSKISRKKKIAAVPHLFQPEAHSKSMQNKCTAQKIIISVLALVMICQILFAQPAMCSTLTVQEQEPKYKYAAKPTETVFIKKSPSVSSLVSNVTAGVMQGVDTNPLLDSTKKADNYTQELVDMHFKYPLFSSFLGFTNSTFGFNVVNTNYYSITDVNTMDAVGDLNIEQDMFDKGTLSAGYVFECLYFPFAEDGTFVGNQFNVCIKQDLTGWAYQKVAYRIILRNYLSNKVLLDDYTQGSDKRFDVRNQFEHEIGVYVGDRANIKITNQFYINDSNYQYYNYYDYYNYRFGTSLILFATKKLYSITAFYYQRRNYIDRKVSDGSDMERDNLYTASASILYDVTKNISVFVNYTHSENHTNESFEKYSYSLYSAGLYYSF